MNSILSIYILLQYMYYIQILYFIHIYITIICMCVYINKYIIRRQNKECCDACTDGAYQQFGVLGTLLLILGKAAKQQQPNTANQVEIDRTWIDVAHVSCISIA